MKKQNNISLWVRKALYTLLVLCYCTSCTETFIEDSSSLVKEGVPVSIDLQFNASTLNKVETRALTDEAEFQVNNLYLLIFDSKGNRKAGSKYYSTDDLNVTNGNQDKPTTGSITGIETTSGKSYIYGIANAVDSELDGAEEKMLAQLNKVNNIDELKAIVATLNSIGNIARSTASLLMSGAFKAESGSNTKEGECVIPTTDASISGALKLRRLDSHITFNIKLGKNISDADFESWQVFNVPTESYLIDQKTQYENASYNNSGVQATFSKVESETSFDFYMQENLKKSIAADDKSELTSYADREKEYKESDNGTNTGRYKYVEENATFVEIKGKLNIKLDNENALRTADVKYTIHLGGGENDLKNFNSLRNAKYIYTVTINDVNSIIVEVENSEEHVDARPGAEGNVVDASAETIILDSHYNCFNLGFTYDEIVNGLSFIIETPFAPNAVYSVNETSSNTHKEEGDYKWIQFQRTERKRNLAAYNSKSTLSIYDLVEDMKERSSKGDTETYYYTVFINEYYYGENEIPAGNNWTEPYWKHFVNKEDRKLLLFLGTQYSDDKESSYSKAKYLIRQKSIQTYYSTDVLNSSGTALGMEHVNETGAPNWGNLDISNLSSSDGFANTNKYFGHSWGFNNWSKYINYSVSESYPYTYSMQDVAAIAECLSRNRDENSNGIIDIDEIKWYLPAIDQLVSMFLGAKSMPSPMFDDNTPDADIDYDDGNNHYITSDKQKLWAEEGCSFGGISTHGDKHYPKNLRCVRNLGLPNSEDVSKSVDEAYIYNTRTRVFAMTQLKEQNKRSNFVTSGLSDHHNFSDDNRPYEAFQMAKELTNRRADTWENFFNTTGWSKCTDYKEGNHKWRAPNQREYLVMFLQNITNVRVDEGGAIYNAFTSTHWKYDTKRRFGTNDHLLFLDSGANSNYKRTIRCVRDVEADASGYIIN